MHILMLLERDFPSDLRVEKEMKSLTDAGHKITLACFTFRQKPEIEEIEKITIRRFPISKLVFRSSVAALKFPVYFDFWRKNLKKLFQENSFDAIHVHDLPLAKVGDEFKMKYEIPLILDLHENWPELLEVSQHANTFLGKLLSSIRLWKMYEKEMVEKADRVIVVVEEAKERLLQPGIKEDKIKIVSNTIDVSEFELPEVSSETRPTLIYAGGLNKHRGLQFVLDAIKHIVIYVPDIKFLIIGEGSYKRALIKKVQDLELQQNVIFTGWLPFDEMLKSLAKSQIALIPHLRSEHTDTTIPHKLFQYFAAEKPVISSDCLPLKRIIRETESGLVYVYNDPEELSAKIINLIEDKVLYKTIQNNQKQALMKYNWLQDAARLIELYRELKN